MRSGAARLHQLRAAGTEATGPRCPGRVRKPPGNGAPGGQAAWPSKDWYHGFASRELDALITQATSANLDLAAARARLTQADARARQAGAAILPSVDATGNGNYLAGHSVNGSAHEFDWSALLSTSYEVDFWGKNRATANAARSWARRRAPIATPWRSRHWPGVADGYFELLSLRERLQIAQSNLDAARGLLEVVQARFQWPANPVKLATQRSVLASAQLALPELQQREEEAITALALLVGRPPEGFRVEGASLTRSPSRRSPPGCRSNCSPDAPTCTWRKRICAPRMPTWSRRAPPCCRA